MYKKTLGLGYKIERYWVVVVVAKSEAEKSDAEKPAFQCAGSEYDNES